MLNTCKLHHVGFFWQKHLHTSQKTNSAIFNNPYLQIYDCIVHYKSPMPKNTLNPQLLPKATLAPLCALSMFSNTL